MQVISGENIKVGFSEENGGRSVVNIIGKGQVTVFPKGLVHYQQNLGCEPATYISALNSEDPGVLTISTRGFDLPNEALATSYGITKEEVIKIRPKLLDSPVRDEECWKTCNIK